MTDPTPQTTPTRDEAVARAIEAADWSTPSIGNKAILLEAVSLLRSRSAPAPASGRVDEVAVKEIILEAMEDLRADIHFDIEGKEQAADWAAAKIASLSPAATPVSEAGGEAVRPEDEAEHFIQAAIDSAPEPLRRLGEWLANKLDDDNWKTADRLITGAAVSCASLAAELDQAAAVISDQNAALATPAASPAGDAAERLADKVEDLIAEFGADAIPMIGEWIGEWRHARQLGKGGDVREAARIIYEAYQSRSELPPAVKDVAGRGGFFSALRLLMDPDADLRQPHNPLSQSTSAGRVGE